MTRELEDVWLKSERPAIRSGPAPTRYRPGKHEKTVRSMGARQWVIVSHAHAKALAAAAIRLGGKCIRYRTSESSSCFKVLEAPWKAKGPPKGPGAGAAEITEP